MKRAKFYRGRQRMTEGIEFERWERACPLSTSEPPRNADGSFHFEGRGEVFLAQIDGRGRVRGRPKQIATMAELEIALVEATRP